MRILTIVSGLGRGGTERAAQTYTLEYQRRGHPVAVLNWGAAGPRQKALEAQGVPVFSPDPDLDAAVAAAEAFHPDIIHIHRRGWQEDIETRLLQSLRKKGRRVLENNVFGAVDRSRGGELIDVHLHLTRWCLWRWRRWFGPAAGHKPVAIVPNPVATSDFVPASSAEVQRFKSAHGIEASAFVCGRVGQPLEGKWHPETLAAFSRLASKDDKAVFVAIGMPPSLQRQKSAFPAALQRRIIELPQTNSDTELSTFYSSLDCFLHAARQGESFGYVLAEAMLCGCPVVTVNQPQRDNSQLEVVGHLAGGVVAGSMRYLGDALSLVWSDAQLRQSIRQQARDRTVKLFDVETATTQALRVAEIALNSGDPGQLAAAIQRDPSLQSDASDEQIHALLANVLGRPSSWDMLDMQIRHARFYDKARQWARRRLKR